MAVFAPIPRARVRIAVAVKPGLLRRERRAKRISRGRFDFEGTMEITTPRTSTYTATGRGRSRHAARPHARQSDYGTVSSKRRAKLKERVPRHSFLPP